MTTFSLADELAGDHVVDYELIAHRHTERASDEANATGTPAEEVGKTIILVGEHGFVRAVIPACERLDLHKLRPLPGCGHGLRLATEEELSGAYPMFELGAVPPFGGPSGTRPWSTTASRFATPSRSRPGRTTGRSGWRRRT